MANVTLYQGASASFMREDFTDAQVRFENGWCYVHTADGTERQFDPYRWSKVVDRDSGAVLGESPQGA